MSSKNAGTNAGEQPLPPPTFLRTLVAGAIAGVSEISVNYPLDVAKTRAHLYTGPGSMGLVQALQQVIREQGVFKLYRGLLSPVLAEAPKRAMKFTAFETFRKVAQDPNGHMGYIQHWICGAGSGIAEAFVNCPSEVVKTRLQSRENLSKYRNTPHAIVSIVKEEGIAAVYKGFEPMLWRNALWNGTFFAQTYYMKLILPEDMNLTLKSVLAGSSAGFIGCVVSNPVDVIKTRAQNVGLGQSLPYKWCLQGVVHVAKTEGPKALYKGFTSFAGRLTPGGGIIMLAYDAANRFLAKYI